MRWLALLLVALLLLPSAAVAQEPVATPTAGVEDEGPDVGDEDVEDPVDEEPPIDEDEPEEDRCDDAGTDADYDYCTYEDAAAGRGDPDVPKPTVTARNDEDDSIAATTVQAQAVPLQAGTLPATGGSPAIIALIGLSFVLIGTGGRLMMASRWPAVESRSSVTWR